MAAKKLQRKLPKLQQQNPKVQQAQANSECGHRHFRRSGESWLSMFAAADGDGQEVQLQWQISENGDDWMVIPSSFGSFHAERSTGWKISSCSGFWLDGQGNPELINSPSSLAVENVNDTPVGLPQSLEMHRGLSYTDTSRVNDEDGIGAISYAWQRSKQNRLGNYQREDDTELEFPSRRGL